MLAPAVENALTATTQIAAGPSDWRRRRRSWTGNSKRGGRAGHARQGRRYDTGGKNSCAATAASEKQGSGGGGTAGLPSRNPCPTPAARRAQAAAVGCLWRQQRLRRAYRPPQVPSLPPAGAGAYGLQRADAAFVAAPARRMRAGGEEGGGRGGNPNPTVWSVRRHEVAAPPSAPPPPPPHPLTSAGSRHPLARPQSHNRGGGMVGQKGAEWSEQQDLHHRAVPAGQWREGRRGTGGYVRLVKGGGGAPLRRLRRTATYVSPVCAHEAGYRCRSLVSGCSPRPSLFP